MAYFISPISIGLGDLIVSLPAIQAIIDSGQDTYLVTRSNLQHELGPRISGLCGIIAESQFDENRLTKTDKYINMREHPLQKNVWWGSPDFDRQYRGFKINDLLEIICKDFDISADFRRLKPLPFSQNESVKDCVAFVPGSDSNYKCWPKQNWLSLAAWFKSQGVAVLMIGKPDSSKAVQELLLHLAWRPTPTLGEALDVLSNVKAVVAVDTGLMHLAVHQGIPTISLYRSHPVYQRDYLYNFSLTARPCDARCVETSLNYTYNEITDLKSFEYLSWECQADPDQFCMDSISYDSVVAIAESRQDLFLADKLNALSQGHIP